MHPYYTTATRPCQRLSLTEFDRLLYTKQMEAMTYAGIAGPLALLGYAIFGTSRHLNVGPSSTVAILSFAVVAELAIGGTEEFIAMTAVLALMTGVVLIISGLLKLGILADFLSKPVLGGFIIGLAITIAFGQVGKIVGYDVEANQEMVALGVASLGSGISQALS